jgi:hypothetical protein
MIRLLCFNRVGKSENIYESTIENEILKTILQLLNFFLNKELRSTSYHF